ncbi:hypothetical protein PSTG_19806 [Puccinia striiformis f. sp. tritici PST-78]|uniref:Uncharacterized protein n=2 Tax=Puccinia striiformis f. sp. tritici TaxID=168172 RepID=A0A0L0UIA6_9BASI|nr:hypothetical protein PSTG_19806 [Puccinia striiformis f. sp. tritici PST-78]
MAMPLAASIVLPACLSRLGQIKANVAFASAYVALQITHWWADRLEHCRPIKESSSICKTTLVGAVFLGFKGLKKASVDRWCDLSQNRSQEGKSLREITRSSILGIMKAYMSQVAEVKRCAVGDSNP